MERAATSPRIAASLLAVAAGSVLSVEAARAQIEGAQVARGSATFQSSGARTVITAANNTVINYQRFDIASGQTVQFVQPSADARVLNRITSSAPTRIDGSLLANGQVYLVNPAGVMFGRNAVIDAARFVAASAKMSDADFVQGIDRFTSVSGSVVNDGSITGGSVHLIGRVVENHGVIVSPGGVVTMISGTDVLLREQGSKVSVRIDGKDLETSATGGGTTASSGPSKPVMQSTTMTQPRRFKSLGAGDVLSVAISSAGVKNIGSVTVGSGSAVLAAPRGGVANTGTINADVASGSSGSVLVHGREVRHAGTITAVAENGQSGRIILTSTAGTVLADGSVLSVAGGAGLSHAGRILVHSYGGSTLFAPGAVIDISGGAKGGDAGFAEVSATGSLGFRGTVYGRREEGYADAELYLDPRDVYITSAALHDADLLDGVIEAYESLDDYFVSAEAIEAFLGNVRIDATRDILISQSIHKTNGDLRLEAGRDIVFGKSPDVCPPDPCDPPKPCDPPDPCVPPPCPPPPCGPGDPKHDGKHDGKPRGRGHVRNDCEDRPKGNAWGHKSKSSGGYDSKHDGKHDGNPRGRGHVRGDCVPPPPPPCGPPPCPPPPCPPPPCEPPPCEPPAPIDALAIEANNVTLVAGRSILDQTLSGTDIRAYTGDIVLQGTSGVVEFGSVRVPSWQAVTINQGESRVQGTGPGGVIHNSIETFVSIKSFNGSVTFDTPDGSRQEFAYINAQAAQDVVINDPIFTCYDGIFKAGEHVQVGADVTSDVGFLLFNSGLNGNGGDVSFTHPGVIIGARDISLIAGGPGIGGDARVDAVTNAPQFRGMLGAEGTSPQRFLFAQNPTVTSEDLPLYEQFGGGLSCDTLYEVHSFEGDIVLNDGSPVQHSNLALRSASAFDGFSTARSIVNADLDLCQLLVEGNATLNADVNTIHTQTYVGPVLVQDVVTLTGTQVFFKSTVDATGFGVGGLAVNGEVAFNADVGGAAPLGFVTINGPTTIGGGGLGRVVVRTTGDQRYNGAFWFVQDAAMTSLAGGIMRFGGTLDGTHRLTLQTPDGLIVFGGDVGTLAPLTSLTLCTDAIGDELMPFDIGADRVLGIPRRATIVGEHDLTINVGDFAVCTGEKFTVLGDLTLNATGSATVGDITTVGDMRITSPVITILRRPAADLFASDGSLREDRGVDFVAGGSINFDGAIALAGSDSLPPPRFGSPTGTFSETLSPFERREMDPAETSIEALVDELNRVLDQRVPFGDVPPPPPPPPTAELEDARPRDPRFADSVIPTVYDIELLRGVAIAGRGASIEGAMGLARSFYVDAPAEADAPPDTVQTAATRFDIDSIQRLANLHDSIFGSGTQADDQTRIVRDDIQAAIACYQSVYSTQVIDPHAFATFLNEHACGIGARDHFKNLHVLLNRMRDIGLTPIEYIAMRNRLLTRLAPADSFIGVTDLAHAIEAYGETPASAAPTS